jgi:hypothetical protein
VHGSNMAFACCVFPLSNILRHPSLRGALHHKAEPAKFEAE